MEQGKGKASGFSFDLDGIQDVDTGQYEVVGLSDLHKKKGAMGIDADTINRILEQEKSKMSKLGFDPDGIEDIDSFKAVSVLKEIQRVQCMEDARNLENSAEGGVDDALLQP